MKVHSIVFAAALLLLSTAAVAAEKEMGTVAVGAQTGAVTYGAGGSVTYTVTVTRDSHGAGRSFDAALSLTSPLPPGATATFAPNPVKFPHDPHRDHLVQTATLTIRTVDSTPAGLSTVTVNAVDTSRQDNGAEGASGTVAVEKAPLTVTASSQAKVYGAGDPPLTFQATGFKVTDSEASVLTGGLARATGETVSGGPYAIGQGTLASNSNYSINYVGSSMSITSATLTVTADSKNKNYGGLDPALTFTPSGTLYFSDTYEVIGGVALAAPQGAAATAGTHAITASGGTAANYNVTHVAGTLTVGKAVTPLTVKADDKAKTYGATDPALTSTSSGPLFYGDTYAVITGVALVAPQGAAATAGTHAITASGGTATNYDVNHAPGTLTVGKAPALTVKADDKAKTYGGTEPTLTYTPSGTLYYGDTYAVITCVAPAAPTGAAATAGTHAITISGCTAANYNVSYVAGTLTVGKAAGLTVTADDKSKTYGGTPEPTLTYTPSGTLYYSDTYSVITGVALATVTGAQATAGTHAITASGGTAANYNVGHVAGTLTVGKAACLTVTVDSKKRTYGDTPEPALTYTPSGTLYYSDTYSVITGVALATATGAQATAGTHVITASGGTATNYCVIHVSGTLTVNKAAALTVTADNKAKAYGNTDPTLTYTPSGTLYYSDTYAVITGVALTAPTGAAATAGKHTIAGTGGTAANYNVNHVDGSLAVGKAVGPLTVTADDKAKTYGDTDPTLTYTASGTLYYGDTYGSVQRRNPNGSQSLGDVGGVISGVVLSAPTGAAATAGTHTINASGGTAANYEIEHDPGTLTVGMADPLTVTADNKQKTYGGPEPTLTYTPSGTLHYGDTYEVITGVALATVIGARATAGTHEIRASGGTAANYTVTHVAGTLTVDKAVLTVKADDKQKTYGGTPEPTLTYTPGGTLYYGDTYSVITGVALATATGPLATAGTHAITALGGTAANYVVRHFPGTLTVDKAAALTVTADNKAKTYGGTPEPVLSYTASGTLYYRDTYAVITGVALTAPTGAAATAGAHTISATGGTAANYNVRHVDGLLAVAKAGPLTVTPDNKQKTYGGTPEPVLTYTASGMLYYRDTYAVITGVALTAPTGALATAGTHAITASGGTAANYNVRHGDGTLTVLKAAALAVTADDKQKTYGGTPEPTLTYTPSGTLYYRDTYAVITGVTLTAPTGAAATAGTHTISATGGTAANYNVRHVDGALTVLKAAALTVTADNKAKTYGGDDPSLTYTPGGVLYYSDTYAVIRGVVLSAPKGAAATAGTHAITASGGTAANYGVDHFRGALTVAKAGPLTVTADNQSNTYGADDLELTYTPSGTLYYTDTYAVITGVALTAPTGAAATAGTHTIDATGGTAANYNVRHVDGTLTVLKAAALTVTADNKAKTYGGTPEPTLTYTPSGTLYYSDAYSVITGVALATATGAQATAGTHAITASGGAAANYEVAHVNGTLSVAKAGPLTVTADPKAKTYGGTPEPTLTYTASGTLYYGDTYAVITGVALSTQIGALATADTHPITASGGAAANYNVDHVAGTLTVAKAAPLTVTADPKAKTYGGTPEPTLTYTASGTLYYGDTYAVITGVALLTQTGALATAGTHPITASGGSAANYNVDHVNGTLTVAKAAALTVRADNKSKTYGGTPEPTLTYTASGTLYYGNTYAVITGVQLSAPTGAAATAGTHTITATSGTAANYEVVHVNGTLTVAKAPLTVLIGNYSSIYGGLDPVPASISFSGGGLYYGDPASVISPIVLTTARGADATAGTHPITGSGGLADNYAVTITPGLLTVAKAVGLTVTADNKAKTYGGSPEPTLTYTPSGTLYYTDTYAVITGVTLGAPTMAAATAGTHPITAANGTAANYEVAHVNGTLTVGKAGPLTATADNNAKTYGDNPEPTLTYTPSGTLHYTDTYAVITNVTLTTAIGADATTGTHVITASGGIAANYTVEHAPGTLTVGKAALAVTADNKQKTYGGDEPKLTFTPSGPLFYTDTYAVISGVALGAPTGAAATAGTHEITISGGIAANYDVSHDPGTLTVDKAPLTITVNSAGKTFGATVTFAGTEFKSEGLKYADAVTSVTLASLGAHGGAPVGRYSIVGSGAVGSGLSNYTITVVPGTLDVASTSATTSLTFTPTSQQYSDVVTFTATVTNGFVSGLQAVPSVKVKVGTQEVGTITLTPSGSSLTGTLSVPMLEPAPFGAAPTGEMSPGAHTVMGELGTVDANFAVAPPAAGTLTITQEAGRTAYTGTMFVATSSTTVSTATVTLSATIQDITATTDAAGDASFGDVRNATVSFINRDNGGAIIGTAPVSLVSTADTRIGTASVSWPVDIGTANSKTFTIGIVVGNYYSRNSSEDLTLVTVSKPLDHFSTGGGSLVLSSSTGSAASPPGALNNFGFSAKYDKEGENPKGGINTLVRSGGHVYQIKGNTLSSVSAKATSVGGTATIKGKAAIVDITNPLALVSIDASATVQILMTDLGEPGTTDSLALTITKGNGTLWFASKQNGSKAARQVLAGGNLLQRGDAKDDRPLPAPTLARPTDPVATALPLAYAFPQNFPNPFTASTSLRFELPERAHVTLTVYDLMGREVASLVDETRDPGYHVSTWSGRSREGQPLGAGVYFVRIIAKSLTGSGGLRADRRVMLVK